ncbi:MULTISPECIES: oxygen-independent coproporphyrinogen III oxidase [unclassified Leeuwenhoekiella]|uniref:oxygen-independent coproporphyrinogen III oxidase n=1 Tax=unclassified Leeuwenhoekiella TaxID=2615029 RepID=UPI000C4BB9CB|nr:MULTISPECIES: oxygen-independent coproporphyrinogen III oxidase [unclassified Leeuwenhoekiella]MAW96883.1 oxygen-independent coproporphyrinogen III oxidase [Leeuwenhoekiella sp.]MBA80587.1 oxygen-independent coproporphyrinogen III oxidase [Leeuwenhoekiella sp.]|tara:strand:+ start:580 stop:1947 length:1368 start_codon:yes stop_codon:yes gene_type:complete
MIDTALVTKYNVPGPRYTSYPTVPYWDRDQFSLVSWKETLKQSFKQSNKTEGISLYIHLPFCESMCTFCGCTKRITKNHSVETPYIKALLKELALYRALLGERPVIQQVHLGGGTPTFFTEQNLKSLIDGIFKIADRGEHCEMSFEGHPNNTTYAHLETLASLGFTRVCYGVQDYNATVQKAINRIQPFAHVQRATDQARQAGYTSVGHDIIFGLPFQTLDHVKHTIEKTIQLFPDRIAFYSYAHVPWIKGNGQRGYDEANLPTAEEKREQYETGKRLLLEAGYVEIGMDHFALPTDDLYFAQQEGRLHRNFMGYNASKTKVMIGLGVSAISDSWYSFAQNVKGLDEYYHLLENDILPVYRGHILTAEDLVIRRHILNLMCGFQTRWDAPELCFDGLAETLIRLGELEADGLVEYILNGLRVTEKGKAFVRNICLAFDLRLQRNKPETKLFSMTI